MLHVGKLIKQVFDQMPKEYTVVWLARELNCNRANVYDIFRRRNVDAELLGRISRILHHDFFADLSADIYDAKKDM